MQHPFSALEPEYNALMANMRVTRQTAVDAAAARLMANVQAGRYKQVSDELGIPQIFIATSFEREASSNFRLSPAQGDPINRVSHNVPAGRGPFANWHDAAIDAYKLDGLDKVGKAGWTWARLCYEGEIFNGFGYRAHGVHSPYDWAGTNDYTSGKYVSDHNFSMAAVDEQLGVVPMARAMALADPSLDIPGWPSGPLPPVSEPGPVPEGVGGDADVGILQTDLNALGYGPLAVDNNYGRRTRAAVSAFQKDHHLDIDGLSGPKTFAAIQLALKAKETPVTTPPATPTAATPINPIVVAFSSLSSLNFTQWEKSIEQVDGYLGFLSGIPGPIGEAAKVLHQQINPVLESALKIGAKIQAGDVSGAYPDIASLFHLIGNILHPASAASPPPPATA